MRERDGERRQEHRVQVAEEARAVAAHREQPSEVAAPKARSSMIPTQNGGKPEPDERDGPDGVVAHAGRAWLAASGASGTAISTEKHRAERDQPERHGQALERRAVPRGTP